MRLTGGRYDDLRAERGVLVGDVGVGRQALIGEVDVHRPGGQRLAAHREPLPV